MGLGRVDRVLLWTLVPLFGICFALHVREIGRTGLAEPPVFASPAASADAYPTVGGLRLERGSSWSGLEPGDVLLRVGEVDLRGVGYVGFDAIALEQAGTRLIAPVVYERAGERRVGELRMLPYPVPWFRVPMVLAFAILGTLILLRSPGRRDARLPFAAFLTFAIFMTPFLGGPRIQTWVHHSLFMIGGPVAIALIMRWLIAYPPEVRGEDRLPSWLAGIGALHLLVRLNYSFGSPLPATMVPNVAIATDLLFAATAVMIVFWNYRRASPIGRRRLKWFFYSISLFGAVALVAAAVPIYGGVFPELTFPSMVLATGIAMVLIPLGFAISMLRYNLFDIDRLITATASYLMVFAAVSGAALVFVPRLSTWLAGFADTSQGTVQLALFAGFLALVVPLGRALHPGIQRIVFRDRLRVERDVRQLLRDLPECHDTEELLLLVDRRLEEILRPECCLLFLREVTRFRLAESEEVGVARIAPDLEVRSPLVRALERHPEPLITTERSLSAEVPDLPEREAAMLRTLGAEVMVPLRKRKDLEAFLVLGPKRSGDIYTAAELALLRELCDRGSSELGRVAGARELELEPGRSRELADLKQRADEANLEKTRFLAAASHDLRQPLHALGFFAQTLAEQVKSPAALETLAKLETSAHALQEMMTKLLDLSRLDASAVRPELVVFELQPVLRRLATEFEGPAAHKGLRLRAELLPTVVESDPVLLGRIVSNLLSNAIRYTESGDVILRSSVRGARVQIDVSDTGPGIPEDQRRHVFDEFVRLHERKAEDGLGLGLSIVERLSKLLSHELTLRTELGAGSTFSLRVPRALHADRTPTAPVPIAGAELSGRTLMVVDDDIAALEATRELLRRWGCEVIPALDVEEAVALAQATEEIDAILADYRLARGITGLNAIARIRAELRCEVPAVVVTGETTPETREAIRAAGLQWLTKPVPPHKLRAMLTELLRR